MIMKKSDFNTLTLRARQLPPHAYHPNPSLRLQREGYIARPD